ncbi:hypothetical protein SPFM15_00237 [Salmonella phage SPFM15]|nr:hypothetical protein SPFM5_00231 [Salmonella phage SPFM5]VFR13861.1 hypothetical protein SPFM15_00237 [Salmonella phage SPFM15]
MQTILNLAKRNPLVKGNNRKIVGLRRNLSLVRRCCGAAATRTDGRELSMVLFSPDGDEDL